MSDGELLPVQVPLFPLPNVVLFPGATVPLHIFEPRYRLMVERCLEGGGVFGMVLAREADVGDDPTSDPEPGALVEAPDGTRFHAIGSAGRIIGHQGLPDGRSYILVEGQQRFRVSDVDAAEPYLTARVAYLRSASLPNDRDAALHATLTSAFANYLEHCQGDTDRALTRVRTCGGAAEAADAIAACMDLASARRQSLLEVLDPAARCAAVLAELGAVQEVQALSAVTRRAGWPPPDFSAN